MPLPAMRAGKHDRLAYCVVVNLATKPEDPGTGPAPRLVVADCCPGCAYLWEPSDGCELPNAVDYPDVALHHSGIGRI